MKYKLIDKTTGEQVKIFDGILELLEHLDTPRLTYIIDDYIPHGLYAQIEGLFEKLKADEVNKYNLLITDYHNLLFNDVLKIIKETENNLLKTLSTALSFVSELHGTCEMYTYNGLRDEDTEKYFKLEDAIIKFYADNEEVIKQC